MSDERLFAVQPCLTMWQKCLICATIIYFVTKALSEPWPVVVIAELSYTVEGNSGRQMMAAGGKLLCNCSTPYCMCYSVNKMRIIYFVSADL